MKKRQSRLEVRKQIIKDVMLGQPNTTSILNFAKENKQTSIYVLQVFQAIGLSVKRPSDKLPEVCFDWYKKYMLSTVSIKKWNADKQYKNWVEAKLLNNKNFQGVDNKSDRFIVAYEKQLINSLLSHLMVEGYIKELPSKKLKLNNYYYDENSVAKRGQNDK